MPVDPQIQALLDKGTGVPATHTLPVDVARVQYEARISLMARPADIAGVREQTINGPQEPLRLRIHAPRHWSVSAAGVLSRQWLRVVQPRYP